MVTSVRRSIYLPPKHAKYAEEIARAEGKTMSAVVQDALRAARAARLKNELQAVRGFWSCKAMENVVLTEKVLARYLCG